MVYVIDYSIVVRSQVMFRCICMQHQSMGRKKESDFIVGLMYGVSSKVTLMKKTRNVIRGSGKGKAYEAPTSHVSISALILFCCNDGWVRSPSVAEPMKIIITAQNMSGIY